MKFVWKTIFLGFYNFHKIFKELSLTQLWNHIANKHYNCFAWSKYFKARELTCKLGRFIIIYSAVLVMVARRYMSAPVRVCVRGLMVMTATDLVAEIFGVRSACDGIDSAGRSFIWPPISKRAARDLKHYIHIMNVYLCRMTKRNMLNNSMCMYIFLCAARRDGAASII